MRNIVLIFLLALSAAAYAEPTPKQLELGQKLAGLLRTQSMFEAYLKKCLASGPAGTFDPKTTFNIDPSSFGGVSPQSKYWSEVETIYRDYQSDTCAYLTPEGFQSFYARKYAEYASEDDLQAAINFYSSPAGIRLQQSSVRINEAFQEYAQEVLGNAYKVAYTKLASRLRQLARKYREEPR